MLFHKEENAKEDKKLIPSERVAVPEYDETPRLQ